MLCKTCKFSRTVPSKELHEQGYIGCAIKLMNSCEIPLQTFDSSGIIGEIYEGWITNVYWQEEHNPGSFWTNKQLVVKNVERCSYYSPRSEY